MSQVTELVLATDERPILPADLQAALKLPAGAGGLAEAEDLADQSAEWLTGNILAGRPPWRSAWREVRPDDEIGETIHLSRWPVEKVTSADTIPVSLGPDALEDDLYVVEGQCRNVLSRDPEIAFGNALLFVGPIFADSIFQRRRPGVWQDFSIPSFIAGHLMPGQVTIWSNTTTWLPGASVSYGGGTDFGWAQATDRTIAFRFEVTAAAAASTVAAEPIWPTVLGESVTATGAPNDVTFTARAAPEQARIYQTAMIRIARHLKTANDDGKRCDDDAKLIPEILNMIRGAC